MTRISHLEFVVVSGAILLANFTAWRYGGVNFNYGDMLFCVSLCLLVFKGEVPRLPFGSLSSLWYLCFAIVLAAITASSLLSLAPTRALIISSQYTFAYVILTFVLMGRGLEMALRLLKAYVLSIAAVCLIGLWFFHFTETKVALGHVLISGSNRVQSVLGNANAFAGLIAITLPVGLYLWTSRQMRLVFILPLLAILVIGLVASSSVSGLANAVLGIFVFLVLSGRLGGWRVITGMLVVGIGLGLFMVSGALELPPTFERRVLEPLRSGNLDELGTYSARMELIEEAIEALDDTLLLGMGADQFRTTTELEAPVHNLYLLLWVEGGLPALVGWLGLLGVAAAVAFRALLVLETRQVGALALSVVLLFASISFNTAHVYARFRVVPLLLTLGLVMALREDIARRRAAAASAAVLAQQAHRPEAVAGR
jgi:O-antigen ligase